MPAPTDDIQKLLVGAFDDQELETFCLCYFHEVSHEFVPNMSKEQKIQHLIDYCRRCELLPTLLAALRQERPYASTLVFLRKVGGGYIFVHRLVMEHFATLNEEDIERITSTVQAQFTGSDQ